MPKLTSYSSRGVRVESEPSSSSFSIIRERELSQIILVTDDCQDVRLHYYSANQFEESSWQGLDIQLLDEGEFLCLGKLQCPICNAPSLAPKESEIERSLVPVYSIDNGRLGVLSVRSSKALGSLCSALATALEVYGPWKPIRVAKNNSKKFNVSLINEPISDAHARRQWEQFSSLYFKDGELDCSSIFPQYSVEELMTAYPALILKQK